MVEVAFPICPSPMSSGTTAEQCNTQLLGGLHPPQRVEFLALRSMLNELLLGTAASQQSFSPLEQWNFLIPKNKCNNFNNYFVSSPLGDKRNLLLREKWDVHERLAEQQHRRFSVARHGRDLDPQRTSPQHGPNTSQMASPRCSEQLATLRSASAARWLQSTNQKQSTTLHITRSGTNTLSMTLD